MAKKLDTVLYTAHTHTTGGRDGAGKASDGALDVKLSPPGSGKQGTNLDRLIPDVSQALTVFDPVKPVKDQTVLIRADREVLYEDFMEVVNTLQQNGFYKVGLISEEL